MILCFFFSLFVKIQKIDEYICFSLHYSLPSSPARLCLLRLDSASPLASTTRLQTTVNTTVNTSDMLFLTFDFDFLALLVLEFLASLPELHFFGSSS
ncbi:hypothetical protein L2E82_15924 [Cichorium intybus]|uniref:Uncharacterized protein n=2 Tax=Cichorium intybus TaxID=13427 RepID=A0ACB9F3G3_CICIN|nr:hypothetical protein L2E82_15791 [Cichorium intybus]KAI3765878.1 hypothetical protein L2E82_15924 [Cichorium intybus]